MIERTPEISILVPVKDEVDSLKQLTDEIQRALDESTEPAVAGKEWELIYVDDGSDDGSWDEIVRLSELDPRIHGLRFRKNFGKSAALAAALSASKGQIIATLDGDLQDDPAELPGMIARLDSADLVAGHKADRKDPLGKRLPSKVFNFFTSLVTGLQLRDHNCGLKVGTRDAFTSVPLYGEMHRFLAATCHASGFKVVEHSVHHRPRQHGSSKFGLERYARGGLDLLTIVALTRFSRRPAHLLGGIGLTLGLIGMAILLYLSGVWVFTDQAIGDRPLLLMGVLLVLVAVQLTSLGIIAEMMINREAQSDNQMKNVVDGTEAWGTQPPGSVPTTAN